MELQPIEDVVVARRGDEALARAADQLVEGDPPAIDRRNRRSWVRASAAKRLRNAPWKSSSVLLERSVESAIA